MGARGPSPCCCCCLMVCAGPSAPPPPPQSAASPQSWALTCCGWCMTRSSGERVRPPRGWWWACGRVGPGCSATCCMCGCRLARCDPPLLLPHPTHTHTHTHTHTRAAVSTCTGWTGCLASWPSEGEEDQQEGGGGEGRASGRTAGSPPPPARPLLCFGQQPPCRCFAMRAASSPASWPAPPSCNTRAACPSGASEGCLSSPL